MEDRREAPARVVLLRAQQERAAHQRAYQEKMKSDVLRGRYGAPILKPECFAVIREQEKEKSCIWSNVKYVGRLLLFTGKKIYA